MTAVAVLTTNAVAAVAIGCSLYAVRHLVVKLAILLQRPAIEPREPIRDFKSEDCLLSGESPISHKPVEPSGP